MRFSTAFAISFVFSLSFACNTGVRDDTSRENEDIGFIPMPGGHKIVTEDEMEEPLFKSAVDAAMKQLNDSNACHNFKLEKISQATVQIVSGVSYAIKFDVKPIFDGADKEECSRSHYLNSVDVQPVGVSVWLQPWISQEPKNVTFTSSESLGPDGRFFNP